MKQLLSKPTKNDYIPKVPKSPEATQLDIAETYIPMATLQVKELAEYLDFYAQSDSHTELRIIALHHYLTKNIKYHEDKAGIEEIKLPRKLMADKKGDCEDFTIITSAVFCVWNIPHKIRIADYGEGWQHIYVVAQGYNVDCTEKKFDAVPDPYKVKDIKINPEVTLKKAMRYQTLGKLPVDLITPRETFYLDFWQELLKVGAKTYKKSFSTSTSNITGLGNTFPEYDLTKLVESTPNVAEAKAITKEQYEVRLKTGQIFKFSPDAVAELVNRIGGKEALTMKSSDTGLSPFNKALVKNLMPFASKDVLRPAMTGIYFGEEGVVATNGYSLIWIKKETKYRGIYKDGVLIDKKYVPFESVIPQSFATQIQFDTENLLNSVKQVAKYTNKVVRNICFFFYENHTDIHAEDLDYEHFLTLTLKSKQSGQGIKRIDLNATELLKVLNYIKTQGVKSIKIQVNDYNKLIVIEYQKTLMFIMPVVPKEEIYYKPSETKSQSLDLIKAKALAMKMKALALKL
ncbi:hypothetical protein GOQ04_14715 [Emticicia sp. ODNR4P]|nr:hypothetical protein [Emticicia sp. ODNR4P]